MSAASARHPWWIGPASALGAALLWLLGHTWRVRLIGVRERDPELARTGCVFGLWHQRLLPLVFTHRGRGAVVMISRHRDGELIARVIQHLGFATARGSSTRGGSEAARAMLAHVLDGRQVAITPDGPRGPARVLKPGAVALASLGGRPFVPVAAAASGAWRLRSWDRFLVPRPFARVVVAYGEPITVPADLDDAGTESWRLRLERALEDLTAEVTRLAGGPG